MTLKEMKIKTFSLIEEYYPEKEGLAEDEDVINKINSVTNQIQMDLMKYRKINALKDIKVELDDSKRLNLKELLPDSYQIEKIRFEEEYVDYEIVSDQFLILPSDFVGNITIFYYKYPELVKVSFEDENERKKEDDEFNFELDLELLEIMPYGIAADLLKMDMISGYGRYFYERYLELKNSIDPKRTSGMIDVVGGIDV